MLHVSPIFLCSEGSASQRIHPTAKRREPQHIAEIAVKSANTAATVVLWVLLRLKGLAESNSSTSLDVPSPDETKALACEPEPWRACEGGGGDGGSTHGRVMEEQRGKSTTAARMDTP